MAFILESTYYVTWMFWFRFPKVVFLTSHLYLFHTRYQELFQDPVFLLGFLYEDYAVADISWENF